jgi:MFS family permease
MTRGGFLPASAAYVTVFAAGAAPIPLYGTYRAVDGITDADLSLAAVCYFVCAVLGLLVLGRLSNHLGRKPVALTAIVLAVLGAAAFTLVHGAAPLLLGRALQGVAAGLAASALAAYVVDTAPAGPRWLVATVTSAGTNIGLALGAFGAAALFEYSSAPRQLPFIAATGMLLIVGVALAIAPETARRRHGALASLRPRLGLPAAATPHAPAAAAVFLATWALGGYYQSFGPSVARDSLHSSNTLVAAAVFASYLAPTVLGGVLTGTLRPAVAQRAGMVAVVAACGGLIGAIAVGSAALFIAAGVVGGLGQGAAMAGSMRALLPTAAPAERAGLLSLVYATSYLGAAIPSLVAGRLSRAVGLFDITIGYGVLVLVALVVVLNATGGHRRRVVTTASSV